MKLYEPAKLSVKCRTFIACPECQDDSTFDVTHLLDKPPTDRNFGPWQCRACGVCITGHVKDNVVTLLSARPGIKPQPGYALLRLTTSQPKEQTFLIVEYDKLLMHNETDEDWVDLTSYRINESTCPTNLTSGDRIKAIVTVDSDSIDTDPHGIFECVAWAALPENLSEQVKAFPHTLFTVWLEQAQTIIKEHGDDNG